MVSFRTEEAKMNSFAERVFSSSKNLLGTLWSFHRKRSTVRNVVFKIMPIYQIMESVRLENHEKLQKCYHPRNKGNFLSKFEASIYLWSWCINYWTNVKDKYAKTIKPIAQY